MVDAKLGFLVTVGDKSGVGHATPRLRYLDFHAWINLIVEKIQGVVHSSILPQEKLNNHRHQ